MGPALRRTLSRLVGWLADRRVPGPLRAPVYRAYSRLTGANAGEAQLPLRGYASLGAFFVRRLRPGLRPLAEGTDTLLCPADGRIQAIDRIRDGTLLQAKGRPYAVRELLAGAATSAELEGAWAVTIYLGPRDYHRVHAPRSAALTEVRWVPGDRRSVSPRTVAGPAPVFATNERAVLRLEAPEGVHYLVMVGALNVGRIRVVGVEPGESPPAPLSFTAGGELARFEMGSTVVLVLPPGRGTPRPDLACGERVLQGSALGSVAPAPAGA